MLENKTFLQGINYLKANYINWGFDLNNDLMLKVWYKKLCNLDDETYIKLIEKYTDINKYAPNSPAELLGLLRDEMIQKELNPNEAWELVLEIRRKYICFAYDRDSIYKELEDKPALYQTVKQFERDIEYLQRGDTNTPVRFKNAYKENVERMIYQKSSTLLASGGLKLLENM